MLKSQAGIVKKQQGIWFQIFLCKLQLKQLFQENCMQSLLVLVPLDTLLMLLMKNKYKTLDKRLNLNNNNLFVFQGWVWRAAVLERAHAQLTGKA